MAHFTYVGPQTFFQLPPETEGGDPEEIRLTPGDVVKIPDRALDMAYVKRLQAYGYLSRLEPEVVTLPAFSPLAEEAV